MSRSWRWRSGRRSGSSSDSLLARGVPRSPGARVVLAPADRLSEGVLVEARVRGRLFGAPILRLDAELVLAPTRADEQQRVEVSDRPDPATRAAPAPPAVGAVRPGSALARAVALADQSAQTLRRNGASGGERRQR